MSGTSERPSCFRCRHFVVTHDARFPYGCRLFAMRTRALPSIEVERTSGRPCGGFEAKPTSPPKPKPRSR